MSEHPAGFRLDAYAAGDADAAVGAHLAKCPECAAYVEKMAAEAEAFRATSDAAGFAAKVAARARAEKRAPARPRSLARVVWIAAPALAAAAAFTLWIRGTPDRSRPHEPIGIVAPTTGTHFKGGLSVVAIRERDGAQERLSGPFEVAPSDRVRIEVAIDRDAPVAAGLLSTDGTWTPLLAPTELTAGTHFSELAARFDDSPTDALLLVGAPDDVARARATHRYDGVVAWRVRSEASEPKE